MAKLTPEFIRENWARVNLTRGFPVKYRDKELWFPTLWMREAGMDDLLNMDDKSDKAALERMLSMSKVLACEGVELNSDGSFSDPVFPDATEILGIFYANVNRPDVKPKDFKRMGEAFKAYNGMVDEDIHSFLILPGETAKMKED